MTQLRALGTTDPITRKLVELDVTGNGRIDPDDERVWGAVADAALTQLTAHGKGIDPKFGLYHGPKEGAPAAMAHAKLVGGTLDLSALDDDALRVVAVEAKWHKGLTRLALLHGEGPATQAPTGGAEVQFFPGYQANALPPAALCTGIQNANLKPYVDAGLPVVAIFDYDSTVVEGNVMDPFLAVLVARKFVRDEANPKISEYLLKLADIDTKQVVANDARQNAQLLLDLWSNTKLPDAARPTAKDMFYLIVSMMKGMPVADAAAAAKEAYTQGAGGFGPWNLQTYAAKDGCGMRKLITLMKERGITPYLLSATLDLLAFEAAEQIGIPRSQALGSVLEVKDGKYTGEVQDSAYYTKGAITRQWLPGPPLLAFGDSVRSDYNMVAEAVGVGFMVNNRPDFVAKETAELGGRLVGVTFDGTEAALGIKP